MEYGLAAYAWTRDIHKAHRLAGALECGNIFVSTYRHASEVPVGGTKRSGYGCEHGIEAQRERMQVKSVLMGFEP